MILYFADRRMNILGQASTGLPKGVTITNDLKTEDIDEGVATLQFELEYDAEWRKKAEEWTEAGNYILRKDGDDREFYTIISRENNPVSGVISEVYAEDAGLDLLNEVVGSYTADQAYPIAFYIEKFSYDSGFEIGINEIGDLTRKLSWDGEATATERLLSVATQFDNAEISFSFEVSRLSVIRKYINIYKKRGMDAGVQLRIGKEIKTIRIKDTIEDLATAYLCTGGIPDGKDDAITLSGYTYDDGDFYVEGAYLKSRKALEKWSRYQVGTETGNDVGHIVKTFSYDTTSQSELCNRAVSSLKKICDINTTYEIELDDLPRGTKVGDTVAIIDNAGKLYLSSRLLHMETSVCDDTQTAQLGEYKIKDSGISEQVRELAEAFEKVAKSSRVYTWIAYADDENGTGISLEPNGKVYMGTAANRKEKEPDLSDPAVYEWVRVQGETGNGIASVKTDYQAAASGVIVPTGTWQETPPATSAEEPYLWTRTVFTYTNNETSISYSVGSTPEGVTVGGRNLFARTDSDVTVSENLFPVYKPAGDPLEEGEVYTASMSVTPGAENLCFKLFFSKGNYSPVSFETKDFSKQTLTKTFSMQYAEGMDPGADIANANVMVRVFSDQSTDKSSSIIHWLKIEKGNKATDWTPAPEDVAEDIENAEKAATYFMEFDEETGRLEVGNKTQGTWKGFRSRITDAMFEIINEAGSTVASYGRKLIQLGKDSTDAIIELCGGKGRIKYESSPVIEDRNALTVESDDVLLKGNATATMGVTTGQYDIEHDGTQNNVHVRSEAASMTAESSVAGERFYSASVEARSDGIIDIDSSEGMNKIRFNGTGMLDLIYPVGAIYISYGDSPNATKSPAELWGGSWEQIKGKFLYCNEGTATGGSATHRHWQTVGLDYSSGMLYANSGTRVSKSRVVQGQMCSYKYDNYNASGSAREDATYEEYHTPPYLTVYAWRRIA